MLEFKAHGTNYVRTHIANALYQTDELKKNAFQICYYKEPTSQPNLKVKSIERMRYVLMFRNNMSMCAVIKISFNILNCQTPKVEWSRPFRSKS